MYACVFCICIYDLSQNLETRLKFLKFVSGKVKNWITGNNWLKFQKRCKRYNKIYSKLYANKYEIQTSKQTKYNAMQYNRIEYISHIKQCMAIQYNTV